MYTIISGTNRQGSNTKKVALEYSRLLSERNIPHRVLALDEHDVTKKGRAFEEMQEEYLFPAKKFIVVLPEYNGSFPGIFKLLIDNSDVAKSWHHKKILLTGVATGRAGNLRGMEHISGSFLHMKMLVHPNRLPVSAVDKLLDTEGRFTNNGTLTAITTQLDEFIKF